MGSTQETGVSRRCQWCDTESAGELTHCPACGASLALRETIGDLIVPGVTHVDPVLKDHADDPLRIPRASPSQYFAGPAVGAAIAAGPAAGLVALGGLAAVAANEFLGAGRGAAHEAELEKFGQLSGPVQRMVEQLDQQAQAADLPAPSDEDPDSEKKQTS